MTKDIDAMLTNSALHTSFKVIYSKTERLQFDDVLLLLRELLHQHFSDAVETTSQEPIWPRENSTARMY